MQKPQPYLISDLKWKRRLFLIRVVMSSLQQEKDLGELVSWAERKRLKKPLQLYRNRSVEVQERLFWLRRHYGILIIVCKWIYIFGNLIFPSQKYKKQGSAAKYRRRKR